LAGIAGGLLDPHISFEARAGGGWEDLSVVLEVLAGGGVIDHFGDVGGVIADPLDVLGDEQQVGRLADVVRVLHHEGQQGAEDRVVEIVDRGVAFDDPDRGLGVALDEGVEDVVNHLGGDARHFGHQRHRLDVADILQQRDALGDVFGVIANALDHARNLERGDDIAQVAGHRRAQRDQLDRAALGLDLERVELLVVLDDPLGAFQVAIDEAAHRFADGVLGQPAHLADERAQPIEILVEGL